MLAESAVDHVDDVVNGDGCLGDVGGEDDFAGLRRRGLEDLRLHFARESRIDRKKNQLAYLRASPSYSGEETRQDTCKEKVAAAVHTPANTQTLQGRTQPSRTLNRLTQLPP